MDECVICLSPNVSRWPGVKLFPIPPPDITGIGDYNAVLEPIRDNSRFRSVFAADSVIAVAPGTGTVAWAVQALSGPFDSLALQEKGPVALALVHPKQLMTSLTGKCLKITARTRIG